MPDDNAKKLKLPPKRKSGLKRTNSSISKKSSSRDHFRIDNNNALPEMGSHPLTGQKVLISDLLSEQKE
jgi:hypothetical protein